MEVPRSAALRAVLEMDVSDSQYRTTGTNGIRPTAVPASAGSHEVSGEGDADGSVDPDGPALDGTDPPGNDAAATEGVGDAIADGKGGAGGHALGMGDTTGPALGDGLSSSTGNVDV